MFGRRFDNLFGGRKMDVAVRDVDRRTLGFFFGAQRLPFLLAEDFEYLHGIGDALGTCGGQAGSGDLRQVNVRDL